MWKLFIALACLFLPALAGAQVTVIVPEIGDAWEVRTLSFAPTKLIDDGVSVVDINDWNEKHKGMKNLKKICLMDFVQDNEIYSANSITQKEIQDDLKKYPGNFFQVFLPDTDHKFLVRVGAFQMCEPDQNEKYISFMALVVTNQWGRVLYFDEMNWNLTRLFKGDDGIINALGCFSCGDVKELAWDKSADRFYFIDVGH